MSIFVKVKNLNGTSSRHYNKPKNDNSWIDGWKRIKGFVPYICSNSYCINEDLVGAHVQIADGNDKKWYIIPLCKTCNKISSDEIFEVEKDLLVSVDEINN